MQGKSIVFQKLVPSVVQREEEEEKKRILTHTRKQIYTHTPKEERYPVPVTYFSLP